MRAKHLKRETALTTYTESPPAWTADLAVCKSSNNSPSRLAALDAITADDYLDHAAFPWQGHGLAGLKQRVAYLFEAFDPHGTVHDIVAERDIVVMRWSHSGIHRGEFLGLRPAGREFTMRGIDMYRANAG